MLGSSRFRTRRCGRSIAIAALGTAVVLLTLTPHADAVPGLGADTDPDPVPELRVVRSTSVDGPRLYLAVDGPYLLEDWAAQVLRSLAVGADRPIDEVVTHEHMLALIAFAHGEGGGVDDNLGRFNPLNTKKSDADLQGEQSGSVPGESFATRDYPDFASGVEAAVRTIELDHYSRLREVLLDPHSAAAGFFAAMALPQNTRGNMNWSANDSQHLDKYLSLLDRVRADYPSHAGVVLEAGPVDDGAATEPDATTAVRKPAGTKAQAREPILIGLPILRDLPL